MSKQKTQTKHKRHLIVENNSTNSEHLMSIIHQLNQNILCYAKQEGYNVCKCDPLAYNAQEKTSNDTLSTYPSTTY
jgi:hypothetical protein